MVPSGVRSCVHLLLNSVAPSGAWLANTVLAGLLLAVVVLVPWPGSSSSARAAGGARVPLEVRSLRSANSDTLQNPDGSLTTRVYLRPVNFRDQDGSWRRIVAAVVPSERQGFVWENGANRFKAQFKDATDTGFLLFSVDGGGFDLSLEGASAARGRLEGGSGVRYDGVFEGVDAVYEMLPQGVKESLVLGSAVAPSSYRFVLRPDEPDTLRAVEQADGSVAFLRKGAAEPAFLLAAPTVSDTPLAPGAVQPAPAVPNPLDPKADPLDPAGASSAASADPPVAAAGSTAGPVDPGAPGQQLPPPPSAPPAPGSNPPAVGKASLGVQRQDDGSFAVTLRIDDEWLHDPARVFPVVLDPTITTQADVQDGYWDTSAGTNTPNVSDSQLWAGRNGAGGHKYVSPITFNLTTLPPGAKVLQARMRLYWTECMPFSGTAAEVPGCLAGWQNPAWNGDLQLFRLTSAWTSATPWSSVTKDTAVQASTLMDAWNGNDVYTRTPVLSSSTLATTVQGMVNGSTPNYGFLLEKNNGNDNVGFKFASSRYADVTKSPSLDIDWTADGVQVYDAVHVHSNGAELSWQHFNGGLGPYGQAVLADSPSAYWRMDDAAGDALGIADISGNGVNAKVYNGGISQGQPGATADGDLSTYFDGAQGRLTTSKTVGPLVNIADTFTLEAWIKRSRTSGDEGIISHGQGGGKGFYLKIDGTGSVCINEDQPTCIASTGSFKVNDLNWHHIVATKSGSSAHIYVDGVDRTSSVSNVTFSNGLGTVEIGAHIANETGGFDEPFHGWIDDTAIYDHVLTLAQAQTHFAARLLTIPGFDRFEIHRSATSGFTPSASTLIATLRDVSLQSYRDTTAKKQSTFYYKVLTITNGGSYSSNQVSATTPDLGLAQITIQPGVAGGVAKATSISSSNLCANQGAAGTLTLDSTTRPLLQFDLRAIPAGATASSASLKLFTFSTAAGTVSAARATADWTEGTETGTCNASGASWQNRQPNVGWSAAGGDYDNSSAITAAVAGGNPHWDTWNVQPIVAGWLNGSNANLGFLLKHQTEAGAPTIAYTSNEYTTSLALRPQLLITYSDNATPLAPQVAIGYPAASQQLAGTVTVTAGASDDGSVTGVQFKVDGSNLGSLQTTAPYSVSWSTTTASRGSHTLTAVATDDAGNTTTSPAVTVTVANSAVPTVAAPTATVGSGSLPAFGGSALLDDFNRADGGLGSGWVSPAVGDAGTARIVASEYQGSASAQTSALWNGFSAADEEVFYKLAALSAAGDHVKLYVRADVATAGATSNYQLRVTQSTGTWEVRKTVAGTASTVATFTRAMAAGDSLGFRAVGTTLEAWYKSAAGSWTLVGTTTDSSVTAAGYIGIGMGFGITIEPHVDDFGGGTVSIGSASTYTVTTTASDDIGVARVDFYVDGNRFASDSASPYAGTLDTLAFPVYDGSHQLTAKAYDADGNATTSLATALAVANTAGTKYKGTITTNGVLANTTGTVPAELRYDPAAGSQDAVPLTVNISNTSDATWPAASVKLRYRWLNPDGSEFSNSGDISIGATDLAAAANRNVAVTVQPTALTSAVLRGRLTLRVDLYDTVAAAYFAAKGNQPFEQTVTVTRVQADELGLERYQQYDGEDLGGGATSSVNLANGNNVVQWQPFNEPGRGLNTAATISYNSLEAGSVSPLGNNWSLAVSGLTPFGLPLDLHPNAADTAAGRTAKWVGLTDADGSYHRFVGNAAGTYYTAPAGVHLYLKSDAAATADKRWQLLKPDRTAFFFDAQGFPTRAQDGDGNALVFGLQDPVPAGEDAYGIAKRVTTVTDAGGRAFTIAYYSKAETSTPALRGKVKTISDHLGHKLRFDYYDDGNLLRVTEEGGTNANGSNLPDRSLTLTYTNAAVMGPAIATLALRKTPDPATVQATKLYSLIDFRGNETSFAYAAAAAAVTPTVYGAAVSEDTLGPSLASSAITTTAPADVVLSGFVQDNTVSNGSYAASAPSGLSLVSQQWTAVANLGLGVFEETRAAAAAGAHTVTQSTGGDNSRGAATGTLAVHAPSGPLLRHGLGARTGNANTDGGLVASRPAGVAAGDLVVAVLGIEDATLGLSISAPDPSWTSRGFLRSTTGAGQTLALFTKTADASEPATYTFPVAGGTSSTYQDSAITIAYATSSATEGRVISRTNRTGDQTGYTYNTASLTATVSMPLARTWVYTFDSQGRVTGIDDPVNPADTTVLWTTDNMVQKVTEPTGKHSDYGYNDNGYLTSKTDQLGNQTTLAYQGLPVDANDAAANWEPGRTIGHISRVTTIVKPVGNATVTPTTDYKWTFAYLDTLEDHVLSVTDPLGNATTNSWNADGTLLSTTLPANGDSITRTTVFNTYDNNGLPTQVTDPAGGVTRASYLANGNLAWQQDANHPGSIGAAYQQQFFYDSYGRLGRSSQPKSSGTRPGLLIWDDTGYDPNDNTVVDLNPHYGQGDSGSAQQTTNVYDAMDRPTSSTGPRAAADGGPASALTAYDAAGRPVSVTAANGVKTAPSGSAWTKDFETDTGYDKLDRVATVTGFAVDAAGLEDPAQGRVTNYCYDLAGDLRTLTDPKGASAFTACPTITTGTYTPYSGTYTTKYDYDAAHRQTKTTDPLGNTNQTGYDENGAVTSTTDANLKQALFTYNDRGDRVTQVEPFDTGRALTTKWLYDALGNVQKLIPPRAYDTGGPSGPWTDYVTSNSYDALGRLVKTTLPKNASTTQAYLHYGYDAIGHQTLVSLPTTQTDPALLGTGEKTLVSYWDTGWVYSSTDPANPTARFDYSPEGWQTVRTPDTVSAPGTLDTSRTMYWDYLPDGLLKALRDLGGQRASYAYDADGNRTQANEANGLTQSGQAALNLTSTYTGFDELKMVATPKFGVASCTQTTSYSYDLHGKLATLAENAEAGSGCTTAAARAFTFSYDAADRPDVQTDDFRTSGTTTDDEQYTFIFTQAGDLAERIIKKRPSGTWVQENRSVRTYYDNGQLKTLSNRDGSDTVVEEHAPSYITPSDVYLNGNRYNDVFKLKEADGSSACFSSTCTALWTYDARDRLTQEVNGTGTTTNFTVDPIGNVTQEIDGGATTTKTYNGQQLATLTAGGATSRYLYDPFGNLDCVTTNSWAASTCPADGNTALLADYVNDYANRLIATRFYNGAGSKTDSADYTIDPLNRPVKQVEWHQTADSINGTEVGTTTTTLGYLGETDAVVQETAQLPSATKTRSYALDMLGQRATLSETSSGTTSRFSYVYDPHGSVSLLLDQTSGVKASYGYKAYGAPNTTLTNTSGFTPSSNPYRYTGKRFDSGSATLDMGARRYSPAAGRFLQQDLYYGALDNLGLSSDPLTANRYLYTGANPVNYVEVDGHRFLPDAIERLFTGGNSQSAALVDKVGGAAGKAGIVLGPVGKAGLALSGFTDAQKCFAGNKTSCGLAFAVLLPVGKAAKIAKFAVEAGRGLKTAKAAKAETEVVQRAMSQAELDATLDTGLLRGGRSGRHYVSDALNTNAKRARQRLSLPQTPEVRVDLEVPKGVFGLPSPVPPQYGMPGGGLERTATGSVRCRVVSVRRYC